MTRRLPLLFAAVLGLLLALAPPSQAAVHKGKLLLPQAPAYIGAGFVAGTGSDTLSSRLFQAACGADKAAFAAGQPAQATNVARFLASPFNGLDAWVVDLKAPTMGAFSVKGPGTAEIAAGVFEYDLDLDFFTEASVDAAVPQTTVCPDANVDAHSSSHRCYGHKSIPDEKVGCITGYKDAKGKVHGARYVIVQGALNLKGPIDVTLTTP